MSARDRWQAEQNRQKQRELQRSFEQQHQEDQPKVRQMLPNPSMLFAQVAQQARLCIRSIACATIASDEPRIVRSLMQRSVASRRRAPTT